MKFKILWIAALTIMVSGAGQAGELHILHVNDHHSHLRADARLDLNLGGEKTRVISGGFPSMVALFDKLSHGKNNLLKLHAGDAITGDLYYTLFKGEADAALMHEICFDAFALGNHEFDEGDKGLVRFLDQLNKKCDTAVLGANVVPEIGVSPLTPNKATDYIIPYKVVKLDDMNVGIIGIDIARKTKMSSNPDATTQFLDEVKTAQKYIDELENKGVDHIIILSHFGYENDLDMAAKLTGVDVIVGGDSHSLLGDFSTIGLHGVGPYPTIAQNRAGDKVCVVQAWEFSQIVGALTVEFDEAGRVENCGGDAHLMLADSFKRKNTEGERVEIKGEARQKIYDAITHDPKLHLIKPDAQAEKILAKFSTQIDRLKGEKIGVVKTDLCLERIPGQGRSKICSVNQTAQHGSDIANLVAHAFRDMARTSEIAIQNGGGVRVDVAAGDFSIGDAYLLLPFANMLVELDMTGIEIAATLEDALEYALDPEGSTGAYPYAAGLRWEVNVSEPKGKRVTNIQFKSPTDAKWSALDPQRNYKVVTNDYIASGKDGYLTFGEVSKQGRVTNTYLDYAQSFVNYVKKVGELEKLPSSEYSTQSFVK